jgi:hypothetical protein
VCANHMVLGSKSIIGNETVNSDNDLPFVESSCGDELDAIKVTPRFPRDGNMVEWLC